MVCQNLPSNNDSTSSAKIMKNTYPYAQGYWTQIGAGEAEYTFSWGFSGQFSESQTVEFEETLSYEMSVGIEFENEKMSESYRYSTATTAQSTYSASASATIT